MAKRRKSKKRLYKRPKRYRAMKSAMLKFYRRKGYSKKKAASIVAATYNKTRKKGQKAIGRKRPKKARYR